MARSGKPYYSNSISEKALSSADWDGRHYFIKKAPALREKGVPSGQNFMVK